MGLKTIKKKYRIERSQIAFLRFTLEAYEGLASITTLDSHHGIVRLTVAPGCEAEVAAILEALQQDILMIPQEQG